MTNSKNVKQHIFDSIDEILDKRKQLTQRNHTPLNCSMRVLIIS